VPHLEVTHAGGPSPVPEEDESPNVAVAVVLAPLPLLPLAPPHRVPLVLPAAVKGLAALPPFAELKSNCALPWLLCCWKLNPTSSLLRALPDLAAHIHDPELEE